MCIGFWALKLRCTQYGFCGQGSLQECNDNCFFEVGRGRQYFSVGIKNVFMGLLNGCKLWVLTLILSGGPLLKKLVGGALASNLAYYYEHIFGLNHTLNLWLFLGVPFTSL